MSLWQLVSKYDIKLDASATFHSDICRVQEKYSYLLGNARECIMKYDLHSVEGKIIQRAARALTDIIAPSRISHSLVPFGDVPTTRTDTGISLVTQYYLKGGVYGDTHLALLKNLANPWISDIYLLNEEIHDMSHFAHSHKIHQVLHGKRLTFSSALQFINNELSGRLVVLGAYETVHILS